MDTIRRVGDIAAGILVAGLLIAPAAPASAAESCAFKPVTILGTAGNDTIMGTEGDDVISALEGNDTVNGLGGNDTVCLGPGDDTFDGGAGADLLQAESTLDGRDVFIGGTEADRASYSTRTVPLTISLDGLANDGQAAELDTIRTDVENVTGGQNGNRITGNSARNVLDGGLGADTILGSSGNDTLRGTGGNDTLSGGPGDDFAFGNNGDDTYLAAAGPDGADVFEGSNGTDTASYTARTTSVNVSLDGVVNDGAAGEMDDMRADVENIIGGTAGDMLTVHSFNTNHLNGGQGNDVLDTTDAFISNDTADGSFGVDFCAIDSDDSQTACELVSTD